MVNEFYTSREADRPRQESGRNELTRLSDSGLQLADERQNLTGREVMDAGGKSIGEVDYLFIDEKERKVRFLSVASGGFLGMGHEKLLIPVESIQRVEQQIVKINRSGSDISAAPKYDPELSSQPDWAEAYGYYGYHPYWATGYIYPPFPYF